MGRDRAGDRPLLQTCSLSRRRELFPTDRNPPSLPMLRMLLLLPMLSTDAKLPMLSRDAALPMLSTLEALSTDQALR
jgi:hypothetical protein